ncbi:MAG TPA: ROK family protein [Bacteroidales bacterium]|nr:ROK family protein [Bacteroidales bacterium]HSA44219.1 ROK family protein [Bacteroidales bacterium]
MDKQFAIGIDIGGSHITSVAVHLLKREFVEGSKARSEVNSQASALEILEKWSSTIARSMQKVDVNQLAGIGFAMPGPFDYHEGIARFRGVKKYDQLNGINVREVISTRLDLPENLPVRFMNDATSFAVGEAWMGEASGYDKVVALTLGTGFGSSFVEQGIPVESGEKVPPQGCLYHLPYGETIADDHFSTRWFIGQYLIRKGVEVKGVKELAELYSQNLIVQDLFKTFGRNLGNFIAPWLRRFDAECLVIGGNITQSYHLFKDSFCQTLISNDIQDLHCYISSLGEDAALCGSVRLADDAFYAALDISALK